MGDTVDKIFVVSVEVPFRVRPELQRSVYGSSRHGIKLWDQASLGKWWYTVQHASHKVVSVSTKDQDQQKVHGSSQCVVQGRFRVLWHNNRDSSQNVVLYLRLQRALWYLLILDLCGLGIFVQCAMVSNQNSVAQNGRCWENFTHQLELA